MDGHLPYRKIAEVKLADAVIRILDYAHAFGYDFEGALVYAALQYCQTLHKWSGFRHHQEHASQASLYQNRSLSGIVPGSLLPSWRTTHECAGS